MCNYYRNLPENRKKKKYMLTLEKSISYFNRKNKNI